jgi:tRNA G18 (ribose-2'-O)-methylase SpoU
MPVDTVTSLEARELHPYRTLRQPRHHFEEGIFVAEGEKVVRRLLDSNLEVLSVLCTQVWYERLSGSLGAREIRIHLAAKELVESIVGYNLHQGIMAVGRIPASGPLIDYLSGEEGRFLVALDGLANAENVGVIVRNCAAFGVDGIIVGETSSSPYLRRAVRNSMGAVFTLPVFHVDSLAGVIRDQLRPNGIHVIAAHPAGRQQLENLNPSSGACVVFGNEGDGIRDTILSVCDELVGIPMKRGTDSLNVASASAIFLYEVARLRSLTRHGTA